MSKINFEINYLLGLSTRKFKTEISKDNSTLPKLNSCLVNGFTLHICGVFESSPVFSAGILSIKSDDMPNLPFKCLVSQKAIDYLSTVDSKIHSSINLKDINDPLRIITFTIEIGLLPPLSPSYDNSLELVKLNEEIQQLRITNSQLTETINSLKKGKQIQNEDDSYQQLIQSNALYQQSIEQLEISSHLKDEQLETLHTKFTQLNKSLTRHKRNDSQDFSATVNEITLLHILFYHLNHVGVKGWNSDDITVQFPIWKELMIKSFTPDAFNINTIWKECNKNGSTNRIGLLSSILHCHTIEEQNDLCQNQKHDCTLSTECIFDHIMSEDFIQNEESELTMKGYLQYLIATEFNTNYFRNKSSRIGASILCYAWPLSASKDAKRMFNAIASYHHDDYPSYKDLTKPTNGKDST